MNRLTNAIKQLNYDAIDHLLENPRWQNWQEKSGKNALHYLGDVQVNNTVEAELSVSILEVLLNSGLNLNSIHRIPEKAGYFPATPLWHAYAKGRNKRLYTALLEKGANPNHCMFAIAWNDDVEAAQLFLQHGAMIESGVLQAACHWKRWQIAEWFLTQGADVNEVDGKGNSVLHLALNRNAPTAFIQLLLNHHASVDSPNQRGVTPLHIAKQKGVYL